MDNIVGSLLILLFVVGGAAAFQYVWCYYHPRDTE